MAAKNQASLAMAVSSVKMILVHFVSCRSSRKWLLPVAAGEALLLVLIAGGLLWALRGDPRLARDDRRHLAEFRALPGISALPVTLREGRIRPGETLVGALTRLGVGEESAAAMVAAARSTMNPGRIGAGWPVKVAFCGDACTFAGLEVDRSRTIEFTSAPKGGFLATNRVKPVRLERRTLSIPLSGSLYTAVVRAGEAPELVDRIVQLFEYDVDFNRDIQPRDRLSLSLEKRLLAGQPAGYGDILSARLESGGRRLEVVRFLYPDGRKAYFQANGRPVRRMFLRCPLPFLRVTSRFGMRHHPLLGYSARHNGVDFGAPSGTAVRATAGGVVSSAGSDGVRGQFVILRHSGGFASHYYHLSARSPGIHAGVRVDQGEVIGRVGSTGRSTGPHLHYALYEGRQCLNPLRLGLPTEPPLDPRFMGEFQRQRNRLLAALPAIAPLPVVARPFRLPPLPSSRLLLR